jgi:hypothetical protein
MGKSTVALAAPAPQAAPKLDASASLLGRARVLEVVPSPTPPGPGRMVEASPALVEEMFKRATMLEHGLYGLMAQATEADCDLARSDFYPFWELTLQLTRDLRTIHEGHA